MWRSDIGSYARGMRFVRSIVSITVAAAGVLAATGSPAAATNLYADLSCDRGAGTYKCEIEFVVGWGPIVPSSYAEIRWYVDGIRYASFDQSRFLTGSCVAGSIVDVEIRVHEPAEPDYGGPDYHYEEPRYDVDIGRREARFRCLHIEPPGPAPAPVHGIRP
jgi:hypothetical protein